jgi:hypothetical protein
MSGRLSILTLILTTLGAVAANAQTSIALQGDRVFPENIAASNDGAIDVQRRHYRPGPSCLRQQHLLTARTAWVSEGQLSYLFDPAMKDQKPSLPFQISSVTLPGAH